MLSRKLSASIERNGVSKTFAMGVRWAATRARETVGGASDHARLRDAVFDERYGVSTAGIVSLAELELSSPSWRHGIRYEPTDASLFAEVAAQLSLDDLSIEHRNYRFVDMGCGKGRVLILASEMPFASVTGVELSPELATIARDNLRRTTARRATSVDVLNMDVLDFELPEEPLVLFFYNPFEAPVMRPIVRRIETSLRRAPRDIVVLYVSPVHRSVWLQESSLQEVRRMSEYSIFRSPNAITRFERETLHRGTATSRRGS